MDYILNLLSCEEDAKGKVESSSKVDIDLEVESRHAEVSFVDKLEADNDDRHGLNLHPLISFNGIWVRGICV